MYGPDSEWMVSMSPSGFIQVLLFLPSACKCVRSQVTYRPEDAQVVRSNAFNFMRMLKLLPPTPWGPLHCLSFSSHPSLHVHYSLFALPLPHAHGLRQRSPWRRREDDQKSNQAKAHGWIRALAGDRGTAPSRILLRKEDRDGSMPPVASGWDLCSQHP